MKKSIQNALRKVLIPIIPLGPPILNTQINQLLTKQAQLPIRPHLRIKPLHKFLNGLIPLLKAFHRSAIR